jgi:hypothetical protein
MPAFSCSFLLCAQLAMEYKRIIPLGSTQCFEARVDFDRLAPLDSFSTRGHEAHSDAATPASASTVSEIAARAAARRAQRQVHVNGTIFDAESRAVFAEGSAVFQYSPKFDLANSGSKSRL